MRMEMSEAARDTLNEIIDECGGDPFGLLEEHSGEGVCFECGHTQSGVEPDATGYQCENCNQHTVVGIETAFIYM